MEKIGIEPFALLTQVINFTVIVLLLTKLLYRPILNVLDERKKKIEEGLSAAEKMKVELGKTEEKKQEIINKAKEEGKKIIEEAKKEGKRQEEEIIHKAHSEVAVIMEKGRKELEAERLKMEKELKKQTIIVAEIIAKKVISQVLDEKDHRSLIDKKIREVAKIGG